MKLSNSTKPGSLQNNWKRASLKINSMSKNEIIDHNIDEKTLDELVPLDEPEKEDSKFPILDGKNVALEK